MKKYKVALFIGRFQPFHMGHLWEVEEAEKLADAVVVGIGSSNVSGTADNPWDYETRKKMIEQATYNSGIMIREIIAIPDTPSDEEWVKNVEFSIFNFQFSKKDVVVLGNNEWVNELLEKAGFAVHRSGFYNRDELEGVQIRKMIREGSKEWKRRVPESVDRLIGKSASQLVS